MSEDRADLVAGEDKGQPLGFLCAVNVVQPVEWLPQHFLVEKENCGHGLILGRGRDPSIDGKVGKETSNF